MWMEETANIFSQMVVKKGDDSHGKKKVNQSPEKQIPVDV